MAGRVANSFLRRQLAEFHHPLHERLIARNLLQLGRVVKVDAAIAKRCVWNATTEYHAKSRLLTMMTWGVEQGLLTINPLAKMRKPTPKSRGGEAVMTASQHEGMMEAAPEYLRNVLIALHACDTATDDALAAGVRAGAKLLVVAPCCQKEVRREFSPPPVLAHLPCRARTGDRELS